MGNGNGKGGVLGFPQASHDFHKSNGSDTVVFNREPSLTRQEFAEECDINALMKRYEGHGQTINYLMSMPAQGGQYLDFADLPQTLQEYMAFMQDAERKFMSLPAIVRKEFDNDPVQFVEFASDPDNIEQMREWDLAPPAKAPEEPPAAPTAPPTASAPPGPQPGGAPEGAPAPANTRST